MENISHMSHGFHRWADDNRYLIIFFLHNILRIAIIRAIMSSSIWQRISFTVTTSGDTDMRLWGEERKITKDNRDGRRMRFTKQFETTVTKQNTQHINVHWLPIYMWRTTIISLQVFHVQSMGNKSQSRNLLPPAEQVSSRIFFFFLCFLISSGT